MENLFCNCTNWAAILFYFILKNTNSLFFIFVSPIVYIYVNYKHFGVSKKQLLVLFSKDVLKEHSTFLEIGSFHSPSVKQLSFTVFKSIQLISGSGGSTFSLAQHRSLNRIRPLASRSKITKEFWYFSYLKLDSSVFTLCTKIDGKWKVVIFLADLARNYTRRSNQGTLLPYHGFSRRSDITQHLRILPSYIITSYLAGDYF